MSMFYSRIPRRSKPHPEGRSEGQSLRGPADVSISRDCMMKMSFDDLKRLEASSNAWTANLACEVKFDRWVNAKQDYDYQGALDEKKYIAVIHLKFSHGAVETVKSDTFEAKYVDYDKVRNPGWMRVMHFTTDENGVDVRDPITMIPRCPKKMAIEWANLAAPKFKGGRYEANGTVYRESDIVSYTVDIVEVEGGEK